MDVGMVIEVLTPCMEYGGQPDPSTQMFGIGGDSGKRLGGGLEQNAVHLGLVLVGDGADLRRQGEHHMIIGDWQQLGSARREPLGGGSPLAFGTMPVATRIVGDARVGTVLAALDMTTERGGTAGLDRRHDA
jgi:hypothetical protein